MGFFGWGEFSIFDFGTGGRFETLPPPVLKSLENSPHLRATLHMAAVSAARYNKVLRPVYLRLRRAGKPFKVAIVAITRKLLIHLNSLMADLLKNAVAS